MTHVSMFESGVAVFAAAVLLSGASGCKTGTAPLEDRVYHATTVGGRSVPFEVSDPEGQLPTFALDSGNLELRADGRYFQRVYARIIRGTLSAECCAISAGRYTIRGDSIDLEQLDRQDGAGNVTFRQSGSYSRGRIEVPEAPNAGGRGPWVYTR